MWYFAVCFGAVSIWQLSMRVEENLILKFNCTIGVLLCSIGCVLTYSGTKKMVSYFCIFYYYYYYYYLLLLLFWEEAIVALGCASCNSYASFVLSKLPAYSISRHTHADAWTNCKIKACEISKCTILDIKSQTKAWVSFGLRFVFHQREVHAKGETFSALEKVMNITISSTHFQITGVYRRMFVADPKQRKNFKRIPKT